VSDAPAGRIFLSYRHEDTRHVAGRLYAPLELHFGAGNVFMDVDSIPPGLDFIEAIKEAVGSCNIVLALIGPAWLTVTDERGRRRIDDADDFVALEIKTGLERDILVIPVLVDGAGPPRREDLPHSLAPLANRQVVRLDHDSFSTGITMLMNALDRALHNTVPGGHPSTRSGLDAEHSLFGRSPAELSMHRAHARSSSRFLSFAGHAWLPIMAALGIVALLVWIFRTGNADDWSVSIAANKDWQATKIILSQGEAIDVAAKGQWSPFSGLFYTADGCGPPYCSHDVSDPNNVCNCIRHAGLIGKIDNGQPFAVGTSRQIIASSSGELYLRINDTVINDDQGSLDVTVHHSR